MIARWPLASRARRAIGRLGDRLGWPALEPRLREVLAAEIAAGRAAGEPPAPPVPAVDLRSLVAELTAVRADLRALTRADRELVERVERLERAAAQQPAPAGPRPDGAEALMDLAGRLARLSSRAGRRSAGGAGAPELAALAEAVDLVRQRAEQHLAQRGIERVAGRVFDPACMEALGAVERPELADGQVVEEVEPGWRAGGECLRPARVVVNRSTGCRVNGEGSDDGNR